MESCIGMNVSQGLYKFSYNHEPSDTYWIYLTDSLIIFQHNMENYRDFTGWDDGDDVYVDGFMGETLTNIL